MMVGGLLLINFLCMLFQLAYKEVYGEYPVNMFIRNIYVKLGGLK